MVERPDLSKLSDTSTTSTTNGSHKNEMGSHQIANGPIVSRRRILSTGIVTTAALTSSALLSSCSSKKGGLHLSDFVDDEAMRKLVPEAAAATADTTCGTITIPGPGTGFSTPPVWDPSQGSMTLNADMVTVNGGNTGLNEQQHRSYNWANQSGSPAANCAIPGPTIEVSPGDTISINFTNNLPDDGACTPNVPSCFNPSNIHFHGLHVSPLSTAGGVASDNVLVEVDPDGGQQEYCVILPGFHAPGTHWYHTHRHGSTAIQVEDGMLGAIIVKEPDETHNMVPDDRDSVWIIQEAINGNVYTTGKNSVPGVFLVNGVYQPSVTISSKRMYRWRFINGTATPRGLMSLELINTSDTSKASMYRMAVDGISFYGNKPQQGTSFGLSPGNRSDFLFWIPTPGTYQVTKAPSQVLATITVTDDGFNDAEPSTLTIPGQLPPYLSPITKAEVMDGEQARTQALQFNINAPGGPANPKNATINNQQYSANTCVEVGLNTAEVWSLQAASGSIHPFHIHVNPFQVSGDLIDPDGPNDSSNWIWWDTFPVQPDSSLVPIVHRFADYHGEFVLHCHILIHEDQGMMVNVSVQDDGSGTGPCQALSTSTVTPSGDNPITEDEVNQILADFPPTPANPFPTCSA